MGKHVVGITVAVGAVLLGTALVGAPFALGLQQGLGRLSPPAAALAAAGGAVLVLALVSLGVHIAALVEWARHDARAADWSVPAPPEGNASPGPPATALADSGSADPASAQPADAPPADAPPADAPPAGAQPVANGGASRRRATAAPPRLREQHRVRGNL